jgi:hypothetical protein
MIYCDRILYQAPHKVNVKLSLCLTNKTQSHEGAWESGCIDPHFLDLGTIWRWVVSFTPQPLYCREKSSRYPLDRRLDGPESLWTTWRTERSWLYRDSNSDHSVFQPIASRSTDYAKPPHKRVIKTCVIYYFPYMFRPHPVIITWKHEYIMPKTFIDWFFYKISYMKVSRYIKQFGLFGS